MLVPPTVHWIFPILSLSIPFLVIFNLMYLIFLLIRHPQKALFIFLAVLAAIPFIAVTFQWNKSHGNPHDLLLLSYNVHTFVPRGEVKNSKAMVEWLIESKADILCLQEYHSFDETGKFEATKWIQKHYDHKYIANFKPDNMHINRGLAFFSKFPIIHQGIVRTTRKNHLNGVVFADFHINGDTIRIYNLHLESMRINEKNLGDTRDIPEETKGLILKLRNGMYMRALQLEAVRAHIAACTHPVILAGDFNDLPYSYNYFSLKENFNNAFEHRGRGFGFTYNGYLFFLRIDNHFFSDDFEVTHFDVIRSYKKSDHFPVIAGYRLKK